MISSHLEWRVSSPGLVAYPEALRVMEKRVAAVLERTEKELIWLLEHPPLYTAGTSAALHELKDPYRFPVYEAGRGGRYTYHGPGQRVVYAVIDLRQHGKDVRAHVARLEEWVIRVLAEFDVEGERRAGRIGIWVKSKGSEEKIAAIGVRVRKWIAYHGLSLNVDPDLSHFSGIVPCGLDQFGVTSLRKLGIAASLEEVDHAFKKHLAVLIPES